jgi:hypothetical protein
MIRIRALALLLLCPLLAGCYFDNPLTSEPSKDINSWLLGVWEYKDTKGRTYRARLVPMTGDRYFVTFQAPGGRKGEKKRWEFEGWISRVSYSRFLSLKCTLSSGDIPEGAFVFVNYQVINQNTVITRRLELDSSPAATSYELRAEVRQRLKEDSLMPEEGSKWSRISEIYWDPDYTEEQPFQPLRFPPSPPERKRDTKPGRPQPLSSPR